MDIDPDTYDLYLGLQSEKNKEPILENLIANTTSIALSRARIRMRPDMICPFLRDDKLCHIQKTLGENYLSHVCAGYPREHAFIDGVKERVLSLSCPEAAKLCLLEEQGHELVLLEEESSRRDYAYQRTLSVQKPATGNEAHAHFWATRIAAIQVIKNRSLSVPDRLIILGILCKNLQELISHNRTNEIPKYLSDFEQLQSAGDIQNELAALPSQPNIQFALLKHLADSRLIHGVYNSRFLECYKEFSTGLGIKEANQLEALVPQYSDHYLRYFAPFMATHAYIFENYCLNHIFKTLMPLGENTTVMNEYGLLVINFALIKFLLVGMAGYHKSLTTELAMKAIQAYSRVFENSSYFRKQVLELLENHHLNSLPHMTILLRN